MILQTAGQMWKQQFGAKVYKLSLSTGCTCPNRDSTKGTGGCLFCNGSGDFARQGSIPEQLAEAKALVAAKGAEKYIAYFQSYTNTYGYLPTLEAMFREATDDPEVVALSIGTRADCLGEDALSMLCRLREVKPVTVELGLQSIHEKTQKRMNLCYTTEDVAQGTEKLHRLGIPVVGHVILGFPWETREEMLQTVAFARCFDGIKLQLLHILDNTPLGREYAKSPFPLPTMEEYFDLLGDCLQLLPKDMVYHRLTGDGAKRHLLAPTWTAQKHRVLNALNQYIAALPDNRKDRE